MEKYREAKNLLMELAEGYKKRGISCRSIYDEMSAKLSGVRVVASFDPLISNDDYNEIAKEIGNCIQVLFYDYRKEIGLEDEQ